jgi:Family of unknown function (DUF5670)
MTSQRGSVVLRENAGGVPRTLSRRRAAKETLAARLVSGYTIGAFIHVLLVIALVLLLVQFVSGRRVV